MCARSIAIGALAASVALSGAFMLGAHSERTKANLKLNETIIKAVRGRAGIDAKINNMDAVACVLSLAGCQTSASSCAGWEHIKLKPDTAVYLAGNDTKAGKDIAAHNRFGKKQGCW